MFSLYGSLVCGELLLAPRNFLVTFTSQLAAENSVLTANTCARGCLPFVLGGRQTTEYDSAVYVLNE